MNLSVIIPSKTTSNLWPCIHAVRQNERTARIIVIDDGLEERLPGWEYIDGIRPFCFAKNVNLGIVAAGDDDVIIHNDDALLESNGGFSLMQKAAEEHDDVAIVGAVTNVTGQPLQQPRGIGLRVVPHIAFVSVLIPRRTINQLGMLDERYCIDYGVEDRDYCEAAIRAGMKVTVHDNCYVDHGSLVSTFRGSPHTPRSYAENWKRFLEKWGQPVHA